MSMIVATRILRSIPSRRMAPKICLQQHRDIWIRIASFPASPRTRRGEAVSPNSRRKKLHSYSVKKKACRERVSKQTHSTLPKLGYHFRCKAMLANITTRGAERSRFEKKREPFKIFPVPWLERSSGTLAIRCLSHPFSDRSFEPSDKSGLHSSDTCLAGSRSQFCKDHSINRPRG
jgi:hypothetical protein